MRSNSCQVTSKKNFLSCECCLDKKKHDGGTSLRIDNCMAYEAIISSARGLEPQSFLDDVNICCNAQLRKNICGRGGVTIQSSAVGSDGALVSYQCTGKWADPGIYDAYRSMNLIFDVTDPLVQTSASSTSSSSCTKGISSSSSSSSSRCSSRRKRNSSSINRRSRSSNSSSRRRERSHSSTTSAHCQLLPLSLQPHSLQASELSTARSPHPVAPFLHGTRPSPMQWPPQLPECEGWDYAPLPAPASAPWLMTRLPAVSEAAAREVAADTGPESIPAPPMPTEDIMALKHCNTELMEQLEALQADLTSKSTQAHLLNEEAKFRQLKRHRKLQQLQTEELKHCQSASDDDETLSLQQHAQAKLVHEETVPVTTDSSHQSVAVVCLKSSLEHPRHVAPGEMRPTAMRRITYTALFLYLLQNIVMSSLVSPFVILLATTVRLCKCDPAWPQLELLLPVGLKSSRVNEWKDVFLNSLIQYWPLKTSHTKLRLVIDEEHSHRTAPLRGVLDTLLSDARAASIHFSSQISVSYTYQNSFYIGHGHDGWNRQQLLMFYADNYTTSEYIGFVDTDCLIITFVDNEDLFEDGRPIINARDGIQLDVWTHAPAATFGFTGLLERMTCMTYFPMIVKRAHLLEMRKFMEKRHKKPFRFIFYEQIQNHEFYSQFNIMCAYLYEYKRDEYTWHVEDTSPQWNGTDPRPVQGQLRTQFPAKMRTPKPHIADHARYIITPVLGNANAENMRDLVRKGFCYSPPFPKPPEFTLCNSIISPESIVGSSSPLFRDMFRFEFLDYLKVNPDITRLLAAQSQRLQRIQRYQHAWDYARMMQYFTRLDEGAVVTCSRCNSSTWFLYQNSTLSMFPSVQVAHKMGSSSDVRSDVSPGEMLLFPHGPPLPGWDEKSKPAWNIKEGSLVTAAGQDTLYIVMDSKLCRIPNNDTLSALLTWYGILTLDNSTFNDLMSRGVGNPLPALRVGDVIVCADCQGSAMKTKYLLENNTVRLIPNPYTAHRVSPRPMSVVTISMRLFRLLQQGPAVPAVPLRDGEIITWENEAVDYIVSNYSLRAIDSATRLLMRTPTNETINIGAVMSFQSKIGIPFPSLKEGMLVHACTRSCADFESSGTNNHQPGKGSNFIITSSSLHLIPDHYTAHRMGLTLQDRIALTPPEFARLRIGDPLPRWPIEDGNVLLVHDKKRDVEYYVVNGTRRPIPSKAILKTLRVAPYATRHVGVDILEWIPLGAPLTIAEIDLMRDDDVSGNSETPEYQNGDIFKCRGNITEYVYINGTVRRIPDYETKKIFDIQLNRVFEIDNATLHSFRWGEAFPTLGNDIVVWCSNCGKLHRWDVAVARKEHWFQVQNYALRLVPDQYSAFYMGGDKHGRVVKLDPHEINRLRVGPPLPPFPLI